MVSAENNAFHHGILVALHYLHGAGEDTHYEEIAEMAGVKNLLKVAEEVDREHLLKHYTLRGTLRQ